MPVQNEISAGEKYSVPNLERALQILEAIADRPDGMSISEAAAVLKIPRNSAFRILSTLLAHQYVLRDETTQRFRLSGKLLGLGCKATGTDRLLEYSSDILLQLRDETGETALVGRLIDDCGVVLQQAPSKHPIKVQVEIGTRFLLHTAAPAKAILAWTGTKKRDEIMGAISYKSLTSKTITSRKSLISALEEYRQLGYATDIGEEVEGITCIAAPVFDFQNHPIASIWITGPDMRIPKKQIPSLGVTVQNHALQLSQRLGYVSNH